MLSSRKPLPLALFAAALGAFASLAPAARAGEKELKKADYDAQLTDEDAAEVEQLFVRVVSTGEGECCKAADASESKGECSAASVACNHDEPWESLSKVLTWKPAAWEIVAPLAMARFDGEATENQRNNVLSLLAWQYSEPAVTIASEIAEAHPDAEFSEDQLIAFAEAGSKRFWKRVVELQQKERAVMPTALLALHGQKTDIETLQAVVAKPFDPDHATETWVAALALHRLGQPRHLEVARARLQQAALSALDGGDVDRAAQLALTGEFLHEACSSTKAARLSFLETRRAWHCRERAKELGSADDVFALVEHLSAL